MIENTAGTSNACKVDLVDITSTGPGWTDYNMSCTSQVDCTTEFPFTDENTSYVRAKDAGEWTALWSSEFASTLSALNSDESIFGVATLACMSEQPTSQDPGYVLFEAVMSGEHVLHGFTNRELRDKLVRAGFPLASDPAKRPAQVPRLLHRLHAHQLIAKIPRSRRWRVSLAGRRAMATAIKLREVSYPRLNPETA